MMTEASLRAIAKGLNDTVQNTPCCCKSKDANMVDLVLTGKTANGDTVTGQVEAKPRGCITSYTIYWWDCYTAHNEAGFLNQAFFGADFRDYGWSSGGQHGSEAGTDTYSNTAAPGIFAWTGAGDPYHIAMQAAVIYFYCGKDGYNHVSLMFGDQIQWEWDKNAKMWKGPVE